MKLKWRASWHAPEDPERRSQLERAHRAIDPMFWGERLLFEDAAEAIRLWLSRHARSGR